MIYNTINKLINLNVQYFIKNEVKSNEYFFSENDTRFRTDDTRFRQVKLEKYQIILNLLSILLSCIFPILVVYIITNYLI